MLEVEVDHARDDHHAGSRQLQVIGAQAINPLRHGADDYLRKFFSAAEFESALDRPISRPADPQVPGFELAAAKTRWAATSTTGRNSARQS